MNAAIRPATSCYPPARHYGCRCRRRAVCSNSTAAEADAAKGGRQQNTEGAEGSERGEDGDLWIGRPSDPPAHRELTQSFRAVQPDPVAEPSVPSVRYQPDLLDPTNVVTVDRELHPRASPEPFLEMDQPSLVTASNELDGHIAGGEGLAQLASVHEHIILPVQSEASFFNIILHALAFVLGQVLSFVVLLGCFWLPCLPRLG